ncbi:MAG: hypothetical protein ACM3SY_12640 [Candidatus Omnitrophota bacterium]
MCHRIANRIWLIGIFFCFICFIGSSIFAQTRIPLIVQERAGIARANEPVTLGVPFSKGALHAGTPVRIVDAGGTPINAQFKTMATWSDGSIKWMKCDFQASASASTAATYYLELNASYTTSTSMTVSETAEGVTVTTGPLRFVVSKTSGTLLDRAWLDLNNDQQFTENEKIISPGSTSNGPRVTRSGTDFRGASQAPDHIEIEEQGPMKTVIKCSGKHYNGSTYLLKYETRIVAFAGQSYIKIRHVYANGKSEPTLSDPLDPNLAESFDRYALDLTMNLTGPTSVRFGGDNGTPYTVDLSSGQTASIIQTDRSTVSVPFAYQIYRDSTILTSGSRAEGWGDFSDSTWGLMIANRYFWQKYPKGLTFNANGKVSIELAPSAEQLWVGMGTGDELILYFHTAGPSSPLQDLAMGLGKSPLMARTSPQQYIESRAFYHLISPDASPYPEMKTYIDTVTGNHLDNIESLQLYGTINFGDVPRYAGEVGDSRDASGWGNNYYDAILTATRLFAATGDPKLYDIFVPMTWHFMETDCWNTYDPNDWMNGFNPGYGSYHRLIPNYNAHYGEGIWYYYYLTGDERAREIGLRAADAIVDHQPYGAENPNCRIAYQLGSVCLEAWKNTHTAKYLNHAKYLLIDKILATQDTYGVIGGVDAENHKINGEQSWMMALYSDTLWKYLKECDTPDAAVIAKFAKLADFLDTYARKTPGTEDYWNEFLPPDNANPPRHNSDDPEPTVWWTEKGLIAGTYAYAYDLTGDSKYKTLALNLLDHIWEASQSSVTFWGKESCQAMKNTLHAVSLTAPVSPTIALDKAQLTFGSANGLTTEDQVVHIRNTGGGTLHWTASSEQEWITLVPPVSGDGNGTVRIGVNPSGLSAGQYTGTVEITDPDASNSPQIVTVTLNVWAQSAAPFGAFDSPGNASLVRSSIPVTGWVLDDIGTAQVKIWRDPIEGEGNALIFIGDAVMIEGARPDIESAYPGYPRNDRAGWGYMLLTYGLPNQGMANTIQLHAIAYDTEGHASELGVKTIQCDNQHAVKPFGSIDTPVQGGTVSGNAFVNFGWALTPPPNMIPIDGSTIRVFIDGFMVGTVSYNDPRPEFGTLFPDYENCAGAGGHYYIDTTTYADGLHTLSWDVVDNAGNTDGVGSRYFRIQNEDEDQDHTAVLPSDNINNNINNINNINKMIGSSTDSLYSTDPLYSNLEGGFYMNRRPLERIAIDLNRLFPHAGPFTGYLTVGNHLRPLPVGSTLDAATGMFYWEPGPGFLGDFDLTFTTDDSSGRKSVRNVRVKIRAN